MNIGVLCPSEIAFRRFMPALTKLDKLNFKGVAICANDEYYGNINEEIIATEKIKAQRLVDEYGGKIYSSYTELIKDELVEAIYIPLPPGLHYKWAKLALENGKHVLLEKPSTTNLCNTLDLINCARKNNVALHENYMFVYHDQISQIKKMILDNVIGDVRLYSIKFGFPLRAVNDFRYCKELGGGALLDAGGYVLKYASLLLGDSTRVMASKMNYDNRFNVDIYGSGFLTNNNDEVVQISYGMDNDYKCELSVWGSHGILITNRILTAPVGYKPTVIISKNNQKEIIELNEDDTFKKSIQYFIECVNDEDIRKNSLISIQNQAELLQSFLDRCNL